MGKPTKIWKTASKYLLAFAMVAIVVAAMAWLSGVFRPHQIRPEKLTTQSHVYGGSTWVAKSTQQPRDIEVVGSIQSESQTSIASRIVANVIEIKVSAGERVKRGDLLIVLDDAAPRARVEQAREMLRSAQANQSLAQTELDRIASVEHTGAVSRNQIDEWQTKLAVSKADVARAQQSITETQVALADAQLQAPFDGIVVDRLAEPGEQAFPGRPLLTLYDPARLRLEASVREAYTGKLQLGQRIAVFIESVGQQRMGEVQRIVPASDPTSRSFLVRVHLDDPSNLYPGMYARMRVPLGTESRLQVPQAMIRRVGQMTFVNVLENGQMARRAVRLGDLHDDAVEVLAGLSEGEVIVSG